MRLSFRASRAGFRGVEYLFPYEWERNQLAEQLGKHGLEQLLHNLPGGDWAGGERGIACLPGREQEFQEGAAKGFDELLLPKPKELTKLV